MNINNFYLGNCGCKRTNNTNTNNTPTIMPSLNKPGLDKGFHCIGEFSVASGGNGIITTLQYLSWHFLVVLKILLTTNHRGRYIDFNYSCQVQPIPVLMCSEYSTIFYLVYVWLPRCSLIGSWSLCALQYYLQSYPYWTTRRLKNIINDMAGGCGSVGEYGLVILYKVNFSLIIV